MHQRSVLLYRKVSTLCSIVTCVLGILFSVIPIGVALGFISPFAKANEWYHIAIYGFPASVFFAMSIYSFLCIIDDMRPGFLKNRHNGTITFALSGLAFISLGILTSFWIHEILSDLHEKDWFTIATFHSLDAIYLIGGLFFIFLSVKSQRLDRKYMGNLKEIMQNEN